MIIGKNCVLRKYIVKYGTTTICVNRVKIVEPNVRHRLLYHYGHITTFRLIARD